MRIMCAVHSNTVQSIHKVIYMYIIAVGFCFPYLADMCAKIDFILIRYQFNLGNEKCAKHLLGVIY